MKPEALHRRVLRNSLRYQVLLTLSMLLVAAYGLIGPFIYRRFIDGGLVSRNASVMLSTLLLFAFYKVGSALLAVAGQYFHIWFSTDSYRQLSHRTYTHLLNVPENHTAQLTEGEIQTLVNNDTNRVLNIITDYYPAIISNIVLAMMTFVLLARLSWIACGITAGMTAMVLLLNRYFVLANRKLSPHIRQAWNRKMEWLIQSYKNLTFVKTNLLRRFFAQKYDHCVQAANQLTIKSTLLDSLQQESSLLLFGLLELVLFFSLGTQVIHGTLTLGTLLAIVTLTPRFYNPLLGALSTYTRLSAASANVERLTAFLALPEESATSGQSVPALEKIIVDDLQFRYPGDERSLFKHFNSIFEAHRVYWIAGANGIGKTTLFKLISGCLQSAAGKIAVNHGLPLDAAALESLREHLHYLPQTPYILSGTLEENIRFGGDGDWDFLQRMIDLTWGDAKPEILNHPDRVLAHAAQLSGGEKQLIGLLQMVYRRKPWVLLDEPFAAMDADLRQAVGRLLTYYRQATNATLILISHVEPELAVDQRIEIS